MAKRKVIQEIQALAAEFKLDVVSISTAKHLRVELRRPDGTTGMMTHPVSASDHRAQMNQRAHWRQFAAGIGYYERTRSNKGLASKD